MYDAFFPKRLRAKICEKVPSGPRNATAAMLPIEKTIFARFAGQKFVRLGIAAVFLLAAVAILPGCATQKQHVHTTAFLQQAPPPKHQPQVKLPWITRVFSWVGKVGAIFPHKKKPPSALQPAWIGTIRLVNSQDKFVLIDGSNLNAAAPGDTLVALSSTRQSGMLRMTALRTPPFVIADILDGNPAVGDMVYAQKKVPSH